MNAWEPRPAQQHQVQPNHSNPAPALHCEQLLTGWIAGAGGWAVGQMVNKEGGFNSAPPIFVSFKVMYSLCIGMYRINER